MLARTEMTEDEYRLKPWLRPGYVRVCPWPRQTPIDYRSDRTWYPVVCEARSERKAADWLLRCGFRPYWPHYVKHKRRKDGKQVPHQLSVIPGLVFVPMPTGKETFEAVRRLPGVWDFVMLDGRPQALTEWQINRIRDIEGELNMPPQARPRFPEWCVVGAKVRVRVVGDDHWDLSGPILSLASGGQITVEVQMLGCRRPMTAPVSQVEPI